MMNNRPRIRPRIHEWMAQDSFIREKFADDEITAISDDFCKEYLNKEYAEMARKMAATLEGIFDGTITL